MPGILLPQPVDGPITCPFGKKGKLWKLGYHPGVDFGVPKGTEIRAVMDGKVQMAGQETHFGFRLWTLMGLSSGPVRILYAHCSKLLVGLGEKVEQGQVIALSGNTGERRDGKPMPFHLHLQCEMWPSRELLEPEFYELA